MDIKLNFDTSCDLLLFLPSVGCMKCNAKFCLIKQNIFIFCNAKNQAPLLAGEKL